jgi:hypothetical protein
MTKSTIDRLTSLGEEVLGKASQNPTANRVLQGAMQMRDRVDDLSKRVRGLEALEKRMAQLEKRVAKLEGSAKRETPARAKKTATEQ